MGCGESEKVGIVLVSKSDCRRGIFTGRLRSRRYEDHGMAAAQSLRLCRGGNPRFRPDHVCLRVYAVRVAFGDVSGCSARRISPRA